MYFHYLCSFPRMLYDLCHNCKENGDLWMRRTIYLPCSRILGSCGESINLDSAFSLPPLVHPPMVHPHFCGSLSFLEDPEPLAGCRAWSCFHINVNTLKCRRHLKTTFDFKTYIGFNICNIFKDLYTNFSEKIWLILG